MAIISQRFHDIKTKFHAVTTYRTGRYSVYHICTKTHISKASLMRWNKAFDGTIDSLKKSRRPHSPHPNSHTDIEINFIERLIKRNPDIGLTELYTKLRQLYGIFKALLQLISRFSQAWLLSPKPKKKRRLKNTILLKNSEKRSKLTSSTFLENVMPILWTIIDIISTLQ